LSVHIDEPLELECFTPSDKIIHPSSMRDRPFSINIQVILQPTILLVGRWDGITLHWLSIS